MNSEGGEFQNPRSVTLKSSLIIGILIFFRYPKSSKCQFACYKRLYTIPLYYKKIDLKHSFYFLFLLIDVSNILADLLKTKSN